VDLPKNGLTISCLNFKKMSKFQIFKSGVNSQFYFRFNASNGEQLLSSEGYVSKQGCLNGIASVKTNAPYDATYHRIDTPNDFRYNMVATNREIIARSSEGYTEKHNREHAISLVKVNAPQAPIEDLT
jgi:uncharacterized protein YegP (UPF0339 family)